MRQLIKWLIKNISWIFDGIGVVILSAVTGFFPNKKKKDSNLNITQKSGKNSINIQNNIIESDNNERTQN